MSEHQSTSKGKKRDGKRKLSPPWSFPVEEIQHMLEEESLDDDFVLLMEEETDESDNEHTQHPCSVVQLVDELGPSTREQDVGSTNTTKWKDLPSSATNILFDGPFRMKTPPSEENPYAYFLHEANYDYTKHVLSENVRNYSGISLWKETTTAELKVFVGKPFLMDIIRVNGINDCWRRDYWFNFLYGQFMPHNCFFILLHCMYFASEWCSSNDNFNNKKSEVINPSRELTIDESMVLWCGCLATQEYILTLLQKIHLRGF
ncbi:hypothetical protein J437_LFUL016022 [Ladona fulva]|uniref:PiggyBac transposable element-derived protein domain-containing protein n=1 Tax=Ladona fulva TaxID=123851 RepID=A0A8K0P5W9_LADFU|nr:hypothetical protein J437_LFUL016022 [Ladona fulva]